MNINLTNNPELVEGLPIQQPYDISPWNYLDSESVTAIPNPDIVDWILVELRDAPDAASATGSTMFSRMAGFLLSDGSVVSTDGSSNIKFYDIMDDQLFTVIRHWNHLGILSANPLTETAGVYAYDFTSGDLQTYGNNSQKDLGSAIYGMFAGDADANGTIEKFRPDFSLERRSRDKWLSEK